MDRVVEFRTKTLPVVKMASLTLVHPEFEDINYIRNMMMLQLETRILRDNVGGPVSL